MKHKTLQLLFLVLILLVSSQLSWAHKIRIFAWENGDGTISTEAKFSGGRAAQKVSVVVTDAENGKELIKGQTDTDGMYVFPIPANSSGELQIIVDGGDGHKNLWNHTLSEAVAKDAGEPTESSSATTAAKTPEVTEAPAQPDAQAVLRNDDELVKKIESVIDRKLAPIRKSLAESSDQGPTLQDILGGIGYILGLAGMAAYIQARRQDRGKS